MLMKIGCLLQYARFLLFVLFAAKRSLYYRAGFLQFFFRVFRVFRG